MIRKDRNIRKIINKYVDFCIFASAFLKKLIVSDCSAVANDMKYDMT